MTRVESTSKCSVLPVDHAGVSVFRVEDLAVTISAGFGGALSYDTTKDPRKSITTCSDSTGSVRSRIFE